MNVPPATSVRVRHDVLRDFVCAVGSRVGLPDEKARLLSELLAANDLRGVFSHGTVQMATYAILMRDGTRVAGEVISSGPGHIVIRTPTGIRIVPRSEIVRTEAARQQARKTAKADIELARRRLRALLAERRQS